MSAENESVVTAEAYEKVLTMVADFNTAKARELAAELVDLSHDAKLMIFTDALDNVAGDEGEGRRLYDLFLTAWGSGNDTQDLKTVFRLCEDHNNDEKVETTSRRQRRSLMRRYADGERFTEEEKAQTVKFERADEFYKGDFYVPKIGHLHGYRGDLGDYSATLNEHGWYHFGRLLKVNYYQRELTLTNELGQEVVLRYSPKDSVWDVDELVQNAVQYKGKSILVCMKTGAVDPNFESNEFIAWGEDPKKVTASVRETARGRRTTRTFARISNKRLASRVAKKRRDNANHAASPNFTWVEIGKLEKVTESKNAFTLQGNQGETRRHFIRKNVQKNWEEVAIRAQKLEGQKVLLCLADRGANATPQVIDVVPAKDPIQFLEERYEFSDEEISRRRAAMKVAEEEAEQHKAQMSEERHRLEQLHEEKVRVAMYEARQQLDAGLQAVEAQENAFNAQFQGEMEDAKERHSKAITEQAEMIDSLVLLQDDLRKKEEERQAQEFLAEQEASKQKQLAQENIQQIERVRSKARQIADSINNGPIGRAPREATQHVRRNQMSPWSAASARFLEEQEKASLFPSSSVDNGQQQQPAEDPRDLEIRILQAELRAEKAEKNQAVSEAQKAQLKADITTYRMQSETYRNMSESDRQDLLAQLADYHQEQWTDEEKKSHKAAAAELAEQLKPRLQSSFPVNIPGRYARVSFAMRAGKKLADDNKVTIELREHMWGNDYRVFIEEHMVEIIACLQIDKRNKNQIAAVTFKSMRKGWQKAESEVNEGPAIKKTMTVDEAIKVFEDTQAKLDFQVL